MILGKIVGKTSTQGFDFLVEKTAKKFGYVQVPVSESSETHYVLCQIIELEQTAEDVVAKCIAIGYKDEEGKIKRPRVAFVPGTEVLKAEDKFIQEIIQLNSSKGAYLGKLDGKDIKVYLDLGKMLNKHVAVLAKTGAGKSYTVGVLLEEILEKKVPLLIIDPHGEYNQLKYPNDDKKETALFDKFGIKTATYIRQIQEFGNAGITPGIKPLQLSEDMDVQEIAQILPGKLSSNQLACLYSAMKDLDDSSMESLIMSLEMQESNVKWTIIDNLDYLRKLGIFSSTPTAYTDLVQPGMCSIINLKGMEPEVAEIVVYKLLKDLFDVRKKDIIPPFFVVVEEAHNFCPERSFGEAKCSKILRTIASEGRKFGLGLCVVSQRPARIDKSVLSQCNTQIIMKVTNPNDLRAITASVEGITSESESEIKNLPIGTALVSGVVEMPLFVNIRPKKTKHGGVSVPMIADDVEGDFLSKADLFEEQKMLPLVKPKTSKKDIKLMSDKKIKDIKTYLVPGVVFSCRQNQQRFDLLVELTQGKIIQDPENEEYSEIPDFSSLSPMQLQFLEACKSLGKFTVQEVMDKTGSTFTSVQDMISKLSKQGYLENGDGTYKINGSIAMDVSKNAYYGRIEFDKIDHEMILDKAVSIESVKAKLSHLTQVTDVKDCYIVWYKTVYE